jgi:uncharacterized protein
MTPWFFGKPGRSLFGVLHEHDATRPARGGVLIVSPWGHEAIRTHRLHRVLADRLARLGYDALRFDAYGSGDSGGLDDDVSLAGWRGDILTAHQALAARSGQPVVCWAASRLGAAAALQASASMSQVPRLVLCDPIVDGSAYLETLRIKHIEALNATFGVQRLDWDQPPGADRAEVSEAIGFAIGPSLRAELQALRPSDMKARADSLGGLVRSRAAAGLAEWLSQQPRRWDDHVLRQDFDWTSDDSLNTALVPADALSALLKTIDGHRG